MFLKLSLKTPESIKLFAKYLRNELSEEERIRFEKMARKTQDEDEIYRKVKMLETVFSHDTHRIESLVRDNSEEYIKFLERFGLMGHRLDNIIIFLANCQNAKKMKYKSSNDTYRRINHPTKFEQWCDGLPKWVDVVLIVLKLGIVGLILFVMFFD